ncbi:MAG: response regulator [Ketobacter sp.]|nr:response regulator [Ketobacter sp.]
MTYFFDILVFAIYTSPGSYSQQRVLLFTDNNLGWLNEYLRMWELSCTTAKTDKDLYDELNRVHDYKMVIINEDSLAMDPIELLEVLAEMSVVPWPEFILLSERKPAICPGYNTVLSSKARQRDIFKALHHRIDISEHSNVIALDGVANTSCDKLTVLVADDNVINQRVIQSVLEHAGLRVITANDGEIAMEIIAKGIDTIDLAVLDVSMPIYSGINVVKAMRYMESGDTTPVIMLTADTSAGTRRLCEESGADYYLPKPVKPDQLVQLIQDISPLNQAPRSTRKDNGMLLDTRLLTGLRNNGGFDIQSLSELVRNYVISYRASMVT